MAAGLVAGLALALALAPTGAARAADTKPLRMVVQPPADAAAIVPQAAIPPADPGPGLDLVQGLTRLLNHVLIGMFGGAPAPASDVSAVAAEAPAAVEIVPYDGSLQAGTVIVNLEYLHLYRVLGDGRMELHRAQSQDDLFAMIRASQPS